MKNIDNPTLFSSFIWAGFECTYAKAEKGKRFDLLRASRHDELCECDYDLLKEVGIKTVREGLSWSQIDKGNGKYDFTRFEPMMKISKEKRIQQLWDLNHFDFPDYLDPFSKAFPKQYGEYAKRVLEKLRIYNDKTIFITPINEPSFFAWMCDNGLWAPYAKKKGTEFKKQLIRAGIAAMNALWSIDTNVRFLHTDPYMYRQPLHVSRPKEKKFCSNFNENVKYQSWDMICGKLHPEVGGEPKYLDILGVNYYFYNQQMVGIDEKNHYTFRSISLENKKRLSLIQVLTEIYDRYKKPITIAETGSYRTRRPTWWKYILEEVEKVRQTDIPLLGVCSYPTLDIIPGSGFIVPNSGLWDFHKKDKSCKRIPHNETLMIIKEYAKKWNT